MGLLDSLGGLAGIKDALAPVRDIVAKVSRDPQAAAEAQATLLEAENALAANVLGYEKAVVLAAQSIIVAEAQSESWLTRNWRPLCMVWCMGLVTVTLGMAAFGVGMPADYQELDNQLLTLVTVGLGGYVVSRGGEKIVKTLRDTKPESLDTRGSRGVRRSRKGMAKQARKLREAGFDDEQIENILGQA